MHDEKVFESELVVDAVKLLQDLMHALVVALLVILGTFSSLTTGMPLPSRK